MHKRHLVTLTLFLSALATLPLSADTRSLEYGITISVTEQKAEAFCEEIILTLEEKGLEPEAAQRLTQNLVGQETHKYDLQLQTLLTHTPQLEKKVLIDYLADAALHRKSFHADRYADLVNLMSTLSPRSLEKETLAQLGFVSRLNGTIYG